MSPEAQRIAIAEACGVCVGAAAASHRSFPQITDYLNALHIPNYLSDLNAMHEAHEALTPKQHERYRAEIQAIVYRGPRVSGNKHRSTTHATGAQRAEAFLRTIGKWEDGK